MITTRPEKNSWGHFEMKRMCNLQSGQARRRRMQLQWRRAHTILARLQSQTVCSFGNKLAFIVALLAPMPKEHSAETHFPDATFMAYVWTAFMVSRFVCSTRNDRRDCSTPCRGRNVCSSMYCRWEYEISDALGRTGPCSCLPRAFRCAP